MYLYSFYAFSLLSLYLHTHSLSQPPSHYLCSLPFSLFLFFLSLSFSAGQFRTNRYLNAKRVVSSQLYNINMKYTTYFYLLSYET